MAQPLVVFIRHVSADGWPVRHSEIDACCLIANLLLSEVDFARLVSLTENV